MRRLCCAVLAGWLVLTMSAVYAAPCYGTRMPKRFKAFGGLESYSLINRSLEDDRGSMRSWQCFVLLSVGVTDWLSVDLKGGAGDIKHRPMSGDEIDYTSNFAGGYGLRARLLETGKTKVVLGFQHISVHPKTEETAGARNKAILDDWQWSLLASHELGRFVPYLGARWSRVDLIHRVESEKERRMSDLTKSIGVIAGFDIELNERTWLNFESQFLDGTAVAASIKYAF